MKLFEVEWIVVTGTYMAAIQPSTSRRNKSAFTTKDKAESFYKELFAAASVLQITGSLEANIHEIEIQ